jgi:hypothetical protein
MRRLVVLTALVFGCTDNSLPIESGATTGGSTAGTTTAGTTTAGTNGGTTAGTNGGTTSGTTTGTTGTTGGTTTSGTTTGGTTGGGPGAMCGSACDCMSGLACFQGQCVQSPMGKLFCCDDTASCPSGQFCQGSDGMFGMCGGMNAGQCKTACDCNAGEACFNGGCVSAPQGQLYCCETNCPSSGGGFCQSMDGSFMQCGTGGTTGGTIGGTTGGTTGTSMCMAVACKQDSDCKAMGCARCSMRSGTCRAM